MKKVNLFGCTTAEKLIKLQEAYDSLVNGLVGNANPKGDYSITEIYELGDMVMNDGSSYLYINETAAEGVPVTDKTYWFQIASKGAQGIQGIQGKNGENGEDGISISRIQNGSPYQNNGYTVTPETYYFSDGSTYESGIWAKNGENGGKVYKHSISITIPPLASDMRPLYLVAFSTSAAYFTRDDVKRLISGVKSYPVVDSDPIEGQLYTGISYSSDTNTLNFQVVESVDSILQQGTRSCAWLDSISVLDSVMEV